MKPNIVMIVTDQHTYTTLGAYGSRVCKTPNLDALASDSLVFENAYTVCPICTPARATMQTGVYPFRHGMCTNVYTKGCMVHELPDSETLLSRRLLRQGYSVGYTGKWHLGADKDKSILGGTEFPEFADGVAQGSLPSKIGYEGEDFKGHGGIGEGFPAFAEYLSRKKIRYRLRPVNTTYPKVGEILSGTEGTVPHFLTDCAIEKIGEFSGRGKPFFYMLNYWQPHEPYHVPTQFLDLYRNADIPVWDTFGCDPAQYPYVHNVQHSFTDEEQVREYMRYYYAAVTQVDFEIGRLISFLKEKGLYDDCVILFTADHGETLGSHGGMSDKGLNMFEETVHVPLLLKGPRGAHRAGKRDKNLVQTCDLYATVLDAAGDKNCNNRQGLSLYSLLNTEEVLRGEVVSESSGIDNISYTQRMIRFGNYKFVFHPSDRDELYDLEADPAERVNLALCKEYGKVCADALERLKNWMIAQGDGLIIRYENICLAKQKKYCGGLQ